jgi:hypothetical protein
MSCSHDFQNEIFFLPTCAVTIVKGNVLNLPTCVVTTEKEMF